MAHPLYLTKEERALYDRLSSELKEGWEVKDETLTSYETDDALRIRLHMAQFQRFPEVKELVEKLQSGAKIETLSLDNIPEEVIPTFFFTIGARGISMFIQSLLEDIKTDEDVQGLCGLTNIRHDILETNSSISYI